MKWLSILLKHCNFRKNQPRTCIILMIALLAACTGTPPDSLGLVNSLNLANCPAKPNCVVSNDDDKAHYIEALNYAGDTKSARNKLVHIISSMDGGTVTFESSVPQQNTGESFIYLRAEFQSKWFKFVDDAEFLIEKEKIQVRAAARLGHSDFGVNRKRLESIRQALKN